MLIRGNTKNTFILLNSVGLLLLIFIVVAGVPQKVHAQLTVVAPATDVQLQQNNLENVKLITDNSLANIQLTAADTNTGSDVIQNTLTALSSAFTSGGVNSLVVKGYTLDPLAWAVAKSVLNSVIQSTVKWINSGFNGSPAFVSNLNSTLLATSNSAASSFISQLTTNGSISSPFQNQVASAISSSYSSLANAGFFTSNPYTLNKTTSSGASFFSGNFVQSGGLNTWANAWSTMANNPFGASILANGGLISNVNNAQSNQKQELNFGQGFLSYKGSCNSKTTTGSNGATNTNLSGTNNCANANILTPGSVISAQLNKTMGSGVDQLVTANQIGEIVNALVGQLVNNVLGSGGLSGASQSSTVNNGTSYTSSIGATNSAISSSLATSLQQTLTTQFTTLQGFISNWQTIDTAALAAQSALSQSTCVPNAQSEITTQVQPVLTQAATEISNAQSSLSSLQTIQNELNIATSTNSSTELTQASNDYTTLLASPTLPATSDIQYAQSQSVANVSGQGTGTTNGLTLYSQMNQLSESAECTATNTSSTVSTQSTTASAASTPLQTCLQIAAQTNESPSVCNGLNAISQ